MKKYWIIVIVFKGADVKDRFHGTYEELLKEVEKLLSNECFRYGEPRTILITEE